MLFSRRLSKEEVTDYLGEVSVYELSGIPSCVVLEEHLTDKGLRMAAEGRKLLKKHGAIFRDCTSGADIGAVTGEIIGKWPDVSSPEFAFLSDLVKAHRSLQST